MRIREDLDKKTLSDKELVQLSGGAGNDSSDLPVINISPEDLPKPSALLKNKGGENEAYSSKNK